MKERKSAIKLLYLSGLSLSLVGLGFSAIHHFRPDESAGSAAAVARPEASKAHAVTARADSEKLAGQRMSDSSCAILLTRNVFSIQQPAADGSISSSSSSAAASAASFALKGISQEDNRFTAFVEDSVAKRIVEVHVGDVLGKGQVRDVTLHELDYELAGNIVHVEIGRALDGVSYAAATKVEPSSIPAHSEHKNHHGEAPVSDVEDGR